MKRLPICSISIFGASSNVQSASCFQLWAISKPQLQPRKRPRHEITPSLLHSQSSPSSENRSVAVAVSNEIDEYALSHLTQIANRLGLPIISLDPTDQSTNDSSSVNDPASYSHLLTTLPYERANTHALAIHANTLQSTSSTQRKKKSRLKLDPMFVDLCPPSNTRLGYRMQKESGGEELLLKALGLKKMLADKKKGDPLVVYDLTAGLARDTLIILNSFAGNEEAVPQIRLHMVERDEIVASLVLDAMRRLQLLTEIDTADMHIRHLSQCLTMEEGDAVDVLQRLSSDASEGKSTPFPPDVCYLDPMFPPRKKKSSAVKKDMSILHSLLGTAEIQNDHSQSECCRIEQERRLLEMACKCAMKRVVVKRPIAASPLGYLNTDEVDDASMSPSYDIRGSVNRWDVYVLS